MSEGTFTGADVDAWIDTLDARERAMLEHLIGRGGYFGACDALEGVTEFAFDVARQHAAGGKRKAAKACRLLGEAVRKQRGAMLEQLGEAAQ